MDKYSGKRLDARYEIQELIGVGGMATFIKRMTLLMTVRLPLKF